MFQTEAVGKLKTHILYSVTFLKSHAIYEIMRKNLVELDRPHRWQYGTCALHAGYL